MATDNNKDVTGCASNGVANMILATTNQNDTISGWVRSDTEPYVRPPLLLSAGTAGTTDRAAEPELSG
eukprot:8659205-Heterocapsa_arctica.AAC.1